MFQTIFSDSLPDVTTLDGVSKLSPQFAAQTAELSMKHTELSLRRTMMTLERILMAWLRTSLLLISFGFAIDKVLDAIREKGAVAMQANAPRNLGLFMIVTGMGTLILGIIQYIRAKDAILGDEQRQLPYSLTVTASLGVLVLGFFMLLNLIYGIGGF